MARVCVYSLRVSVAVTVYIDREEGNQTHTRVRKGESDCVYRIVKTISEYIEGKNCAHMTIERRCVL